MSAPAPASRSEGMASIKVHPKSDKTKPVTDGTDNVDRDKGDTQLDVLRRRFQYTHGAQQVTLIITPDVSEACNSANWAWHWLNVPRSLDGVKYLLDWSNERPRSVILDTPGSLASSIDTVTSFLANTAQLPMSHVEIRVNGDTSSDGGMRACFAARHLLDRSDRLGLGKPEEGPTTVVVSIHGQLGPLAICNRSCLTELGSGTDTSVVEFTDIGSSGTIVDLRDCTLPPDASYLTLAEVLAEWAAAPAVGEPSINYPFHVQIGGAFVVPEPTASEAGLTSWSTGGDLVEAFEKDVDRFATLIARGQRLGPLTLRVGIDNLFSKNEAVRGTGPAPGDATKGDD